MLALLLVVAWLVDIDRFKLCRCGISALLPVVLGVSAEIPDMDLQGKNDLSNAASFCVNT